MEAKLDPISPRCVKTSRARVWQEEWDPMPWDFCRRTAHTETQRQTYDRAEQRERGKREARVRRYRQYQVHFYGSPGEREIKKQVLKFMPGLLWGGRSHLLFTPTRFLFTIALCLVSHYGLICLCKLCHVSPLCLLFVFCLRPLMCFLFLSWD